MGRLVWIIAMPITIRSRPRYLFVTLNIATFVCVPSLGMRNPLYTLKESTETIRFGRITVYPKQKRFLRLAYCLNYWVVGTHTPSCHPLSLIVTVLIRKPSIQLGHFRMTLSALAAVNQVELYNHPVKHFATVMAQRLVR